MTERPLSTSSIVSRPNTNTYGIVSMICGLLSVVTFILPLGIPAIILGIIGLKKREEGRGLSITGIVAGGIATLILLSLISLIILVVVFAGSLDGVESGFFDATKPYSSSET